jgi:ADP-ribosylglycohydrolase
MCFEDPVYPWDTIKDLLARHGAAYLVKEILSQLCCKKESGDITDDEQKWLVLLETLLKQKE